MSWCVNCVPFSETTFWTSGSVVYARQEVYGKCGQSERAWELVQSMPDRFHLQPTVIMYTCLISCQIRHKKHADASAHAPPTRQF